MPNYRETYVWNGSAWESLAIAFPDLGNYASKVLDNTFAGSQTFNGRVTRAGQIPYAIEVGTINLPTTTTGDQLVIGTKNFEVGRFTNTPIVMAQLRYGTTVKNGYATVKTVSTTQFGWEAVMSVPVTDSQGPNYTLFIDYIAIQMTA
jgi:hypothetical protein